MKILVMGASRGSGREAVRALAAAGHEVTAFARTASEADFGSADVRRVDGDALSVDEVEKAVIGQDAVVVTLGISDNPLGVRFLGRSSTASDIRSAGTQLMIEAMRRQHVPRLVVQTTYGLGDTWNNLSAFYKTFFRVVIWPQIKDSDVQEDHVRASGLDWTLVRPVALHDDVTTFEARIDAHDGFDGFKVARDQVGRALARIVGDEQTYGQALTLSVRRG